MGRVKGVGVGGFCSRSLPDWSLDVVPGERQVWKRERLPTKAIHLVSEQGVPLVEVLEVVAEGTPQSLESYWCRLRNNTEKDISALAVIWTITWSSGGSEDSHQESQSMDARFSEEGRPLAPGATILFESLSPHVIEGGKSVLKEVQVSVDYVEFADGTSIGPDRSGASERIALRRRGAEAYRQWLLQIYWEEGDDPVVKKLLRESEEGSLAGLKKAEAGLSSPQSAQRSEAFLRQGTQMVRQQLLSLYRKQGAKGVVEKLLRGGANQ